MRPEDRLANPLRSRRIGARHPVSGREVRLRVTRSGMFGARVVKADVPVVDASVTGVGVLVPAKWEMAAGRVISIEISGAFGRAKVATVRDADEKGRTLCGLNFLDPNPKFLPMVLAWLSEEELLAEEAARIDADH